MRTTLLISLLLASSALAQEPPPAPEPSNAPETAEPVQVVVGLGTPRFEVEAVMGRDTFSSVIPSLKRRKQIYADDTQIVFVDDYVISITPGRNARRDVEGNYLLEREGAIVTFPSNTLNHCGRLVSDDCIKCQVDRAFYHLLMPLSPRYLSPGPPRERRISPPLPGETLPPPPQAPN